MTERASPPSDRSTVKRLPERARYDEEAVHAILDEGLVAHVGISVEGRPVVIPMVYGRDGRRLLLHGSVASRLQRHLADGTEVCVTVTLLDGLVVSRSAFHHSLNYRSVVVLGPARRLRDPDQARAALERIVDHVIPGRTAEARGITDPEVRQTSVLEVDLAESSAKARTGWPGEDPDDLGRPIWGGQVPLRLVAGDPEPDEHVLPGVEVPASLRPWRRPGD